MAIVLLVDPSQTIRRVVEMVFKGSGHDVVTATTATDGQQAVARYQPAIILVNYLLPDGSGIQLCKLLKANPPTSGIPVVVMGGTFAPFDENEARSAGADAVLMKPFETAALLQPVSALLDGAVGSSAAASAPQAAAQAAPVSGVQSAPAAASTQSSQRGAPAASAEVPRYAPPAQPAPPPPPQAPPPAPAAVPRAPSRPPAAAQLPRADVADPTERMVAPDYDAPRYDNRHSGSQPQATAGVHVDEQTVREVVEDLLPQIALDTLQQMLADWLEARLRNYIHELVQQELSRYR